MSVEGENFAGAPISIGEARAERSRCASDWTPREMLVAVLRDIDEGKIAPNALVVCFREPYDDATRTGFYNCSPDAAVALGMLAIVEHRIIER